uniref:Uncharacterized protein n=1 Tax=Romanomermis culicivorax TaxID=13658 RepID=A0A915HWR4_ROMCU
PGFGLPKRKFDIACGFGTDSVVSLSAAATEIREAGQRKPVNDTKNDWQHQRNHVVSTDGSFGAQRRSTGDRVYRLRNYSRHPGGQDPVGR